MEASPTETASGTLSLDRPAATGSRLGLSPRETPASVEVITGAQIRRRGDYTTREAVTRATGLTSAATPGNGSTALSARGFVGHGSVMQLYDGTLLYVGAGTVTFPVDTWPLERIEVLRGPASVLYGQGAIGAAINYIPKKPGRGAPEHEALASVASYDTYRTAFGSGGTLTDNLFYRLDLSRQSSSGYVERADYERYVAAGSLLLQANRDLALTLSFDGARNDDARYWGTPLINGAIDSRTRRSNYNVLDSVISYEDRWTRLKAEWQVTPDISLRNETYRLTSDRHWRNLENYTFQPGSGLIRRSGYLEIFHDQSQVGNRFDASFEGTLLGRKNRLVAGLDVNRIKFKHINNSPFAGTSDVDPFSFDPGFFVNLAGTQPKFETRTHQYSVFAEDVLHVTDRVKVVAGVRNDQIDFDRTDLIAGTAFDKRFDPTTWRLGAVFEPSKSLALYAHAGTGVDPLGSLITLAPAQRDFTLAGGRQYEVGLKQSLWGGRADWTLAFYDITKKDLLSRDPANPALTQQIGRQSSRGVELAAALTPQPAWTVEANLALLEARFDDFVELAGGIPVSRSGNLPPNVPEKVANLWLIHSPLPAWEGGVGARYVDRRFANNANTVPIPGYTVADAYVSWRPVRSTDLTLRVRNLFDKQYAVAPYNSGTQFILGDPRMLEVSVLARF